VLDTVTVVISLLALLVSGATAWWQGGHARRAGVFASVLELFQRDVRDKEYQRDLDFVLRDLAGRHSPELGLSGLPDEDKHRVWNVAFLYESIGMLHALGALDRAIALGVFNHRVRQVWGVLEPYVRREREQRDAPFLAFFEHLALEAERVDVAALYRRTGLRSRFGHGPRPGGE
jgi:hypothetical protein